MILLSWGLEATWAIISCKAAPDHGLVAGMVMRSVVVRPLVPVIARQEGLSLLTKLVIDLRVLSRSL